MLVMCTRSYDINVLTRVLVRSFPGMLGMLGIAELLDEACFYLF